MSKRTDLKLLHNRKIDEVQTEQKHKWDDELICWRFWLPLWRVLCGQRPLCVVCGMKYLTIGEFAFQQPSYKIVSKLWIVVFILVDIVCATILKQRKRLVIRLPEFEQ